MAVELTNIFQGMSEGATEIKKNFDAVNSALPVIGEWTSGDSLLTADFVPASGGTFYRLTDTQLQFAGAVNPARDISFSDATLGAIVIKSPVKLRMYQGVICTGTDGAYWTMWVVDDGNSLAVTRYVFPKNGLEPLNAIKKSWWLLLGGASFALA